MDPNKRRINAASEKNSSRFRHYSAMLNIN
jgi:hypothetical protein